MSTNLRTLIFTDQNLTINVRYVVDMSASDSAVLTVMDISGASAAEKALGIDFKQVGYTIQSFTDFASHYGLQLTMTSSDSVTPSVLVASATSGAYYNSGLGLDSL